jgi:putative FmdB family regulatory protein
MPIYEYQCTHCGKIFEIFQKISDEPLKKCRICKGTLHKLISQCSFHLKGTGWYVTDYKTPVSSVNGSGNGGKTADKKEEKTADKKEEKTADKKEEKTDTKTEAIKEVVADSKTETKTETKSAQQTGG